MVLIDRQPVRGRQWDRDGRASGVARQCHRSARDPEVIHPGETVAMYQPSISIWNAKAPDDPGTWGPIEWPQPANVASPVLSLSNSTQPQNPPSWSHILG